VAAFRIDETMDLSKLLLDTLSESIIIFLYIILFLFIDNVKEAEVKLRRLESTDIVYNCRIS
jgi:hypothetical protein